MSEIDFNRMASRLLKRSGATENNELVAGELRQFLKNIQSIRKVCGDILLKEKHQKNESIVSGKPSAFWVEEYLKMTSKYEVEKVRLDMDSSLVVSPETEGLKEKKPFPVQKEVVEKKVISDEDIRRIVRENVLENKREKEKVKEVAKKKTIEELNNSQRREVFKKFRKESEGPIMETSDVINLLAELRRQGRLSETEIILETVITSSAATNRASR